MQCHHVVALIFLRFQLGVWSPCSEKCGGGQQYRNLTCAQVVSKDVTNILPDSECAHLSKPFRAQECNKIDCFPEWIAGNWTQVSRLLHFNKLTVFKKVSISKEFPDATTKQMVKTDNTKLLFHEN